MPRLCITQEADLWHGILSYLLIAFITSSADEVVTQSSETLLECNSYFLAFFLLAFARACPSLCPFFFSLSSAFRSGRDNFFVVANRELFVLVGAESVTCWFGAKAPTVWTFGELMRCGEKADTDSRHASKAHASILTHEGIIKIDSWCNTFLSEDVVVWTKVDEKNFGIFSYYYFNLRLEDEQWS